MSEVLDKQALCTNTNKKLGVETSARLSHLL